MIVAAVVAILLLSFAGVLLFGAPYLPTLTPQVKIALKFADLQKGQTILELGCGDGKVLIAAAKRGYRAIGYELNPILAAIAWARTRRYGNLVKVHCANFWTVNLPPAEAVFVFLLPKYMSKLEVKLLQTFPKGVKLVSFAFTVPDRQPAREEQGVYIYKF